MAKSIAAGAAASIITAKQTTPIVNLKAQSDAVKAAQQAAAIAKGKEYAKKAADAANAFKSYLQTTQCNSVTKVGLDRGAAALYLSAVLTSESPRFSIGGRNAPVQLTYYSKTQQTIAEWGDQTGRLTAYGTFEVNPLDKESIIGGSLGVYQRAFFLIEDTRIETSGMGKYIQASIPAGDGSTTFALGSKYDTSKGKIVFASEFTVQEGSISNTYVGEASVDPIIPAVVIVATVSVAAPELLPVIAPFLPQLAG